MMLGISSHKIRFHSAVLLIAFGAGLVTPSYAICIENASSAMESEERTVLLMVQRLNPSYSEGLSQNNSVRTIDEALASQLPVLSSAIEKAAAMDSDGPYQEPISSADALLINNTLQLPYTNTADSFDIEGNRVGRIVFYGNPLEFGNDLYGVGLGFFTRSD